MTLDCPHLSERFSVPLLTLSVWAFYRFEKLFFLSPIDSSCLVSFLFMWTISVFMWGWGGSSLCCRMTSRIIPWGQWSAGNKLHLGCSETSWGRIMWNRVLGSTCGMSFCFCGCVYCWEVYFFKALDQTYLVVTLPHLSLTLDFNPLFHCLDTVSLYSVCVNWVMWSSWSWAFTFHSRLHVNAHIKWGLELLKVHATLHLFAAICKLKMFSFHNCLFVWLIHVIHSSPGRSVKEAELFFAMWWCQWVMIKCLASLVPQSNALRLDGISHVKQIHVRQVHVRRQVHVWQVNGRDHVRGGLHLPLRQCCLHSWIWLRWNLSHVIGGTIVMCSVQCCVLTQIVFMWKESLPVVCILWFCVL